MAGTFTDIVSISAPSEALAGETVNITVKVKNIYSSAIGIKVAGLYNTYSISFPNNWANVNAGATHSFNGSFTMPSEDATVKVYSYYYGVDGFWRFDDEDSKIVKLGTAPPQWYRLSKTTITLQVATVPPEEGWHQLTKVNLTLNIAGVEGWHVLAKLDFAVTIAGVAGWYELSKTDITLTVGGGVTPPPDGGGDEEEGKGFPWIPVALAGGAVVVGAVALSEGKKKSKPKVKVP